VSDNASLPKVSIITVVRNGASTLQRTIDSIRHQTYSQIEYIIIDGASTDGTLEIIKSNLDVISFWISERDNGIYDGFNKGVSIASGDYIGFLNADDAYSPDQIEQSVTTLEKTGHLWSFGNTWLYDYYGEDIFLGGDPHYDQTVRLNMPSIQQVTVLTHRAVFDIVGLFRTSYRVASDYDWFIRVAMAGIRGIHNPAVIGKMWAGGISTTNQKLSIRESFLISVRNGHPLLEACVFWWMRLRFMKHDAPAEYKLKINAIRARLQRLFGSAAAVPADVAPAGSLSSDLDARVQSPRNPLERASAFSAARQSGIVIGNGGLLYLLRLGETLATFSTIGQGTGVRQAEVLLSSLSLNLVRPEEADVVLVGSIDVNRYDFRRLPARYLALTGDVGPFARPQGWLVLGALPGLLVLARPGKANGS
jgi:glycosyltransferase involved in cell wall biosynthesis